MKKISKLLCVCLALTMSACGGTGLGSSSNSSSSYDSSHSSIDSSLYSSSNSSSGSSSSMDSSSPDKPIIDEAQCAIVDEAYALGYGKTLGYYTLSGTVISIDEPYNGSYVMITFVVAGRESKPIYCYKLQGEGIEYLREGDKVTVYGSIKNYKGLVEFDKNCLLMDYETNTVIPDDSLDPYKNVSKSTFYANYTVATDNVDAYFRSKHGFMSGELTVPDQAPTIAPNRPKNGDLYVRNSEMRLSDDGNTYTVVDVYGNPAFEIYRDGAYITLEEVAAYVYAFGTYPKNHTPSKDAKPSSSIWGEYLRLNHTAFSGDTDEYPYEPVLPNISGCGGTLNYFEMDIGTTGTDCDPSYTVALYNNGSSITRGAARIVYGKKDLNGNGVYERGEFHVFYTYNHYNDFQEYLNYQNGWGEMFGNITGGGTISSRYDYAPTDYVEVSLQSLSGVYGSVKSRRILQDLYTNRTS